MHRHTAFRLLFILAAFLFVAKPFFGYSVSNRQFRPRQITILVKSFSKSKPEGLEDADANVVYLHQLLINPLATILSAISFLLLTLFPAVFKNGLNITYKFLSDIRYTLLPPQHIYLLAGKLII